MIEIKENSYESQAPREGSLEHAVKKALRDLDMARYEMTQSQSKLIKAQAEEIAYLRELVLRLWNTKLTQEGPHEN
jgi:hypothetical protein